MTMSQILLLEQKLAHFEADNIIYQDEISRLRRKIIELQEYRIKYELLLQKQNEQSPLHRSRRIDEINNMNRKIEDNNEKWIAKVKSLQGKYHKAMQELETKNIELSAELDSFKKDGSEIGGRGNELLVIKEQLSSAKSKNTELTAQTIALRCQNKELTQRLQEMNSRHLSLVQVQEQVQGRVQQARQEQKQFYRGTILQLQARGKQMQQEVNYYKARACPERQQQIDRLVTQIKRLQQQHQKQLAKFNRLVTDKDSQIHKLIQTLNLSKSQAFQYSRSLQTQLQQLRNRTFTTQQQHHFQLMACRQQMQQLRQKQVILLKQSFIQMENTYQAQRQHWKLILNEHQQEIQRITKIWEEQKHNSNQQKNALKNKINQLKAKELPTVENQKQITDNQTYKLIQSLKQIDDHQNHYNDYQNNVVFLARQLKRATAKIQEKQRQCAKLLNQLKNQREEFETQTQFIKKVERHQVHYYKQKLLQADDQNSKLLEELREKDKYIRDREAENRLNYERVRKENEELNDIIRQMERDYNRLTENKQSLFQSYRSERDLVFTGKAELNQQRKNKWLHLDRQKNQLEIAYKQREKQIITQYELTINQLTHQITNINRQKQEASAEVETLRNQVTQSTDRPLDKHQSQQNRKEFHKKIAALDLQISLTQNLFSTIKSVRERSNKNNRSQLDQMSEQQSHSSHTSRERKIHDLQEQSLDEKQLEHDNVAPTFSKPQQEATSAQYQNFSFNRQQPFLNIPRANKNHHTEMSFHPDQGNDGCKTPAWGL